MLKSLLYSTKQTNEAGWEDDSVSKSASKLCNHENLNLNPITYIKSQLWL